MGIHAAAAHEQKLGMYARCHAAELPDYNTSEWMMHAAVQARQD